MILSRSNVIETMLLAFLSDPSSYPPLLNEGKRRKSMKVKGGGNGQADEDELSCRLCCSIPIGVKKQLHEYAEAHKITETICIRRVLQKKLYPENETVEGK